jgi:hypothetical protein
MPILGYALAESRLMYQRAHVLDDTLILLKILLKKLEPFQNVINFIKFNCTLTTKLRSLFVRFHLTRQILKRKMKITFHIQVAGSIPNGVMEFFIDINPSDRTMALGSTQFLTEMSTGNISWG